MGLNAARRASAALRRTSLEGLPLLYALLAVGFLVALWGKEVRSGAFLIGDCPYYASAAVSLWTDGDLDLKNQLRGGLQIHGRQVALGRSGQWYPKHPVLLSVLSLPFYAAFSVAGFLLFNLTTVVALASVLWFLCRRHVSPGVATATTLLVMGGTFLRAYIYYYSADLLSALLVLLALLLALERKSLPAGLFLGLSGLAKPTNFFIASIVVCFSAARRPRRAALWLLLGILPGLLTGALLNLALFGSPLISGYDRTLVLENGVPTTVSHRGFFDLPLWEGMRGQLLSPRVGLLTTSPVLLLAIPGFAILLRRDPWEGPLYLGISEFLFLLFSTYRWWSASHYGPRFLMVPVCLAAVPMALTLERIGQALFRSPLSARLHLAATRGR
jgi:Glycosyltransferase family 87